MLIKDNLQLKNRIRKFIYFRSTLIRNDTRYLHKIKIESQTVNMLSIEVCCAKCEKYIYMYNTMTPSSSCLFWSIKCFITNSSLTHLIIYALETWQYSLYIISSLFTNIQNYLFLTILFCKRCSKGWNNMVKLLIILIYLAYSKNI